MKKEKESSVARVQKLRRMIDSLCGIYSRIARRLGVHRTYVSRVAHGERHSPPVEEALVAEYERVTKGGTIPSQQ